MNRLTPKAQRTHRRLSLRPSLSASLAAVAAAALFASVVTGCGNESKTSESSTTTGASGTSSATATATSGAPAQPQASQVIKEAARTTQTLQSVHIVLTATNLTKLPVSSVDADVTNQPQGIGRAIGTAKFRPAPDQPFVDTAFLVTDKTFYTKDPEGKYVVRGPADKIYDPGIILDKDMGLANVIENVEDPKVETRETVNGVAVVKVSGTIDAATIDPVVPTLGQGGGQLPITLWIADVFPSGTATPTTSLASEAPSPGTGPNLVRFVVNKDQGSVDVTLSNWAKPVDIPSPTG
ncbi:MAG: LppX_LprAFG lipoprotein [Candidatus Sericytochromatia bacterium]